MTTTPTVWLDRSAPNYTLNGPGGNDQTNASGIGLSNGNFLIVWETNVAQDSSDNSAKVEIRGEMFDPLGNSLGGEFLIAGANPGSPDAGQDYTAPVIAADDQGGFLVLYSLTPGGGDRNIFLAKFDAEGTKTGDSTRIFEPEEFPYDPSAFDVPQLSEITASTPNYTLAFAGGEYVVEYEVRAEFKAGLFGVSTRVNFQNKVVTSDALDTADVSINASDTYAGYWLVNNDYPDVTGGTALAPLAGGSSYVFAYEVDTGANSQIHFVVPNLNKDSRDGEFSGDPPTATAPQTQATDGSQPDVAGLYDTNGFVIVWRDEAGDGSGTAIRARIYDGDATPVGGVIEVNNTGAGNQELPKVVGLLDGGFVAGWLDQNLGEVRLQRFDAFGTKIGIETAFPNPNNLLISGFSLETMSNGRVLVTVTEGTANKGVAFAIFNVSEDLITGTEEDDTLTANIGDSTLEGLGGDDTLIGLGGDDTMSGGTGTDSFDGGGGNDTVDFTYSNSDWIVNLLTGTAVAGSTTEAVVDIENVNTGGGDDTITGDNGVNILKGNGGDDTISGGQGVDDIDGGSGSDWADYRSEWTGLALAHFGDRTYDLVAGEMRWENVTGAGTGGYVERMANIENVKGSGYNDTFIANFLPNDLIGYGGDDTFISSDVGITIDFLADTYNGGTGIDTVDFSAIAVDDGDTTASRSFSFVLSPIVPAAPAGTVTENGGGLVAQLFGIENLRGTGYDDSIDGNDGANTLNGGGGNDILRGLGGIDDLRGGDGDDILSGGAGVDIFDGGNGSDTVDYSTTAGSATYDLVQQKFLGSLTENWVSIENVIAGAGNDTLIGGAGANTLNGGAGNDTFRLNDASDVVVEAAGGGVDQVTVTFSYTLADDAEVESLMLNNIGSTTALNLTGNLFAQTIAGNSGKNTLSDGGTGGAADILRGYGGNDTYRVNNSLAVVDETAGNGIDTIRTTVSYTLASGAEVENLLALSPLGNKLIDLIGNGFAQTITGNAAVNVLLGLDGDNTLAGLGGRDVLDGGDGIDTLDYSASDAGVRLAFNTGNATGGHGEGDAVSNMENITGSDFDDTFTGNSGANLLDGGDGDDKLNGGNGQDQLTGGGGNDTFVFLSTTHSGAGETLRDSILDFEPGDVIDLSLIDAQESSAATNEAFTFILDTTFGGEGQVRAAQVGADTIVYINTSGNGGTEMQIVLAGFAVGDLSAADFLL